VRAAEVGAGGAGLVWGVCRMICASVTSFNSHLSGFMRDQLAWTLEACARILRPLLRLALRMGIKYAQLDEVVRTLLLEEAHRNFKSEGVGKPNISQLATATGLNRKEVTLRVRGADDEPVVPALPPSAQVFTAWLQLANEDPSNVVLPIGKTEGRISFEELALQVSRGNVHHRAVLNDLLRLGMVTEVNGRVELRADAYLPSQDLQYMLQFLADHTRDHLQAAVTNVLGEQPKMLERAVYADGLTPAECERIHQLARLRWAALHQELVKEMTIGIARSGDAGNQRVKVGLYTLYEDSMVQNAASQREPN
jgi:hypothetical protein